MKSGRKIVVFIFSVLFLTACSAAMALQPDQIKAAEDAGLVVKNDAFEQPVGAAEAAAAALVNPFPSGLLEITDYKYPVFLYAPRGYRPDGSYAMIVIAPSEGAEAEEGIRYLKTIADSKNVFILSPHGLWTYGGDVPYLLDEWILQIKKDVVNRFPINKNKIYVMGKGTGANYAAYLSMKHVGEFTGAALLGQGWDGPFSKIMQIRSDSADQVPFFVAFRADQPEVKAANEVWLDKLQAKGYPIHLTEVKSEADFSSREFKQDMFAWLEETSQHWLNEVKQGQKSFKAQLKKGWKTFFTV